MDDQIIHEIAAKVDAAIIDWCMQSQAGPLTLSGIILARLTWLNDMVNDGEDFRNLCRFISDRPQVKKSAHIQNHWSMTLTKHKNSCADSISTTMEITNENQI